MDEEYCRGYQEHLPNWQKLVLLQMQGNLLTLLEGGSLLKFVDA